MSHIHITPEMARAEQARRVARKAGLSYSESVQAFLGGFSSEAQGFLLSNECSGEHLRSASGLKATTGNRGSLRVQPAPVKVRQSSAAKVVAKGGRKALDPSDPVDSIKIAANAQFKAALTSGGLKAAYQARAEFLRQVKALA